MSGVLTTPQIAPSGQMISGQMPHSPLAAALMMNLNNGQDKSSPSPLSSLVDVISQKPQNDNPSIGRQVVTGVGNLLNGYQWNGMPGQTMMNDLNQQAANNIANGAGNLPPLGMTPQGQQPNPQIPQPNPYGSMNGGVSGYSNGGSGAL